MHFGTCSLSKMAFPSVVHLILQMNPNISFISFYFKFSIETVEKACLIKKFFMRVCL
jgi:hypothetical protein